VGGGSSQDKAYSAATQTISEALSAMRTIHSYNLQVGLRRQRQRLCCGWEETAMSLHSLTAMSLHSLATWYCCEAAPGPPADAAACPCCPLLIHCVSPWPRLGGIPV
jgi:hypothetical protein